MNMQALFFVPGTDGNPNDPCGYCNRTRAQHIHSDHIFDAVGGSLPAVDPRNGPPPSFAPVPLAERIAKGAVMAALSVACWYGAIQLARAAGNALHLLHSYI